MINSYLSKQTPIKKKNKIINEVQAIQTSSSSDCERRNIPLKWSCAWEMNSRY